MATCDFDYDCQVRILDDRLDCSRMKTDDVKRLVSLNKQHARSIKYLKSLDKLAGWCLDNGTKIQISTNLIQEKNTIAQMDWIRKIVYLDSHLSSKTKFFCALHEVGHFLIDTDRRNSGVNEFPHGWNASRYDEGRRGRSQVHRFDIVAEEFEAWRRGKILVDDQKIWYPRDEFYAVRTKMIKSYCQWALMVDGFQKSDSP